MGKYFEADPLKVFDGDVALAADLNSISDATEAGFDLFENDANFILETLESEVLIATDSAEIAANKAAEAALDAIQADASATTATNGANAATAALNTIQSTYSDLNAITAAVVTSGTNAQNSANSAASALSSANTASGEAIAANNSAIASASSATNAAAFTSLIRYTFDASTTMGDPGVGVVRFNNATPASITALAIDSLSASTGNPDTSPFVATWGDSSSSSNRGSLIIRSASNLSTFIILSITGIVVNNSGWLQVPVAYITHSGTFNPSDVLTFLFARTGDLGGGDVAGQASSIDNEIALFSGTTGKIVKRSTTTGLIKATSGVIGAVVSGTDVKTVNSASILGSGDISLQTPLVSGTSLKTVNSTSLLGSGDVAVQPTLVSGVSLKTVNSASLLGSGDVAVQPTLISGATIKTVNTSSLLGAGDVSLQVPLVSGTNIKTINSASILGSGDISVSSRLTTLVSVLSSTYTVIGTDAGKTFTCTSSFTLNLSSAATLDNGFMFGIVNNGVGTVTIDPFGTELIDGSSTISIPAGISCFIACNGTNFISISRDKNSYPIPVVSGGTGATTVGAAADNLSVVKRDHGHGSIGSLCFAGSPGTGTILSEVSPGGTLNGSLLYPAGYESTPIRSTARFHATPLTGIWRCLGYAYASMYDSLYYLSPTLWQRIS